MLFAHLLSDHPQLETLTPSALPDSAQFDVAFSISSFDHDGLGRYGDPIDANGDLRAMRVAHCLLKPGGTMFFTVPVGPDVVVYNLHRRYGRIRLGLLLHGWQVQYVVGWEDAKLDQARDWRRSYEPIFVLKTDTTDPLERTEL